MPAVRPNSEVVKVHDASADRAALDQRLASIVEMKYFGGMTDDEIAGVLELSPRPLQKTHESPGFRARSRYVL